MRRLARLGLLLWLCWLCWLAAARPEAVVDTTVRARPSGRVVSLFARASKQSAGSFEVSDEDEAYVFKRVFSTSAEITKKGLRLFARGVRSSGDTFAGVVTGASPRPFS